VANYPVDDYKKLQGVPAVSISERFPNRKPVSEYEKRVKNALSAIESQHRPDAPHPIVNDPDSIHFGQAAIGEYGIMPKSAEQAIKEAQAKDELGPQMSQLIGASPEEIEAQMHSNKALQEELSTNMLRKIMNKPNVQEQDIAPKWLQGPSHKVTEKDLKSPRQKKFIEEMKKKFGGSNDPNGIVIP
jgi:hypothetical protein